MRFQPETFELPQLRLKRLMRLMELNAPHEIIEIEYKWFQVEVARADKIMRGENAPYTEEQIAELKLLREIENG
jgi:hypothetical protein